MQKKKINKTLPFFVSNGDIITNVNFLEMLNFHNDNKADITILSKFYEETNKYGVITNEGIYMKKLEEKTKKLQFDKLWCLYNFTKAIKFVS